MIRKSRAHAAVPRALWLMLLCGFLLRAVITVNTEGYLYDTNTFLAWANQLASVGPAGFYAPDYFADYPPGYMLVLWAVGSLIRALGLELTGKAALLLLTLVPMLADLALALLIFYFAKESLGESGAVLLSGFVLFNPMLIFDCAVWKQVDSVLVLALFLCFFALMQKQFLPAGLFYAVALLLKPQALLFGPVFALCYLLPLLFGEDGSARFTALKNALLSLCICLATLLGVSLLFQGDQQPVRWLLEKYTTTTGSYPYASINAFNLPALLGGNWVSQDARFLFFSWRQWGILGILLVTLLTFWFGYKAYRSRSPRFSPFLLAAFYCCGVFTLGHNMHERYLVPGVLFLFAAFATLRDRRLLRIAVVLSFTCLINMGTVYVNVGADEFLQLSSSRLIIAVISAVQVVAFVFLCRVCYDNFVLGRRAAVRDFTREPESWIALCAKPVPRWIKFDTVAIVSLTLATALVSLCYLGSTKAPESAVELREETYCTVQFEGGVSIESALVFPGIGTGSCIVKDSSGKLLYRFDIAQGSCFSWQQAEPASTSLAPGETLRIELSGSVTLNELAFKDAFGRVLPASVASGNAELAALFDEPDTVPNRPDQRNGMYFDEIYHGRTAFEMLHGLDVYETTHPPLGKDFILLGVALLGMNTLGWRIMGALFGIAMVPVFYLLARRLLGRRRWSAFATALFALDFMRFTQSRIATIDVFVVFFILLATYFMLAAIQTMLRRGTKFALWFLAGSGLSFGLACASKWTGFYAGAGLCVLFFGALIARRKLLCTAFGAEEGAARFKKDFIPALLAGVVFFVLVPAAVYLLSYLPYFLRQDTAFGLREFWACQQTMFGYHSTLTATHPFQSAWYSWPLIWRPVWYYMGTGLPSGSYASIAVLGNPIVWWGGLIGLCWLCCRAVRGKQGAAGSVLLISFAAQLLPWVFVSRAVFLYHYFACVPFIILALTMLLMQLETRRPSLAKKLRYGLPAAALALFCFFYPVLSGLPIARGWAAALKWLPSWGFYIL